jgi:hypothetical protein
MDKTSSSFQNPDFAFRRHANGGWVEKVLYSSPNNPRLIQRRHGRRAPVPTLSAATSSSSQSSCE